MPGTIGGAEWQRVHTGFMVLAVEGQAVAHERFSTSWPECYVDVEVGGRPKEQEMPTPNTSPIERAFELARSGRCRTTADIARRLKAEGYSTDTVIGPVLMRKLRSLIDDAHCSTRRAE